MSIDQFFSGITGKLLNATTTSRSYYCKNCKKSKPHTPLSYSDLFNAGQKESNDFLDIVGRITDYVPAMYPLTLGNPYFCNECNRILVEGGVLSGVLSKKAYYHNP